METATLQLTRSEANTLIRFRVSTALDEVGLRELSPQLVQDMLTADLGVFFPLHNVYGIAATFHELANIEDGTHRMLERNASRTVDNTQALTEYYDSVLNTLVDDALDRMGF